MEENKKRIPGLDYDRLSSDSEEYSSDEDFKGKLTEFEQLCLNIMLKKIKIPGASVIRIDPQSNLTIEAVDSTKVEIPPSIIEIFKNKGKTVSIVPYSTKIVKFTPF